MAIQKINKIASGHLIKEYCHKISVPVFMFVFMIALAISCTVLIIVDK